ncbi:MAG: thiamine pyrophosphate-requiring protein [Gammaproteobacteria bacterium]|nr:thiamine pyrophosphate-requiring protein [Gammaproteobacteria bacterium]
MNNQATQTPSVAGVFLDALLAHGIEHVFANAGTDFAPVIEALVEAGEQGRRTPCFHTIPHENIAMAMAHGYYLASGKPAAVMVHVTVGTANALCGIMNANRDNVPVLLFAGHTPSTETGHAGSRSAGIHWGQDSFDQGGMVREYVKWDYELRAGQRVDVIVARALDIAMSEPRGPVYVHMPREVLGDMVADEPVEPRNRPAGATPPQPAPEAIATAARWIAEAEFPLILTASLGRDRDSLRRLADLAEKFAVAVGTPGEPGARDVNIPTDHPMYLGTNPRKAVERADVIVIMDCEVPFWPRDTRPKGNAKFVHIAPDPLFSRYPYRGFEMDLAIAGSSSAALQMLHGELEHLSGEATRAIESRRRVILELGESHRRQIRQSIAQAAARKPIHPVWVAACINEAKRPDAILINELGVPMDALDLREPGTYMTTSPAAGLGFGTGAALGARLAAPDRQVILVVGDGSYMFGNPVASHFVARAEQLPTLTVVMNNGRWHAVNRSTVGMYPQGRAAASEHMPLVDLAPAPDYERVMQACGGFGERVGEPADLPGALRRGLDAVERGVPALLNVITQPLND